MMKKKKEVSSRIIIFYKNLSNHGLIHYKNLKKVSNKKQVNGNKLMKMKKKNYKNH